MDGQLSRIELSESTHAYEQQDPSRQFSEQDADAREAKRREKIKSRWKGASSESMNVQEDEEGIASPTILLLSTGTQYFTPRAIRKIRRERAEQRLTEESARLSAERLEDDRPEHERMQDKHPEWPARVIRRMLWRIRRRKLDGKHISKAMEEYFFIFFIFF